MQAGKPDALNIPDLRRTAIAGAAVIALAFGAFAAWAALAPIAGAVIAAGTVKVDSNRKTVQHLEGGIVHEIRVRDGDRVEAGQVLVVLQDTTVDASVDLLSGQLLAESAKVARLTAERDGADQVRFPAALTSPAAGAKAAEILRGERHLFSVRLGALEEQVRSLQSQIEEARHEVANVTAQVESETRSVEYLQEEVAVNERLYQDKFINKSRLLALRRELAETEARRSEHQADLAQARQRINELELRILSLRTARVQNAADELDQSTRRIYDLRERLRPSQDAARRQQVVAPVAGEVVNMRVHTLGGVIGPREPILDIVPKEKALVIEARVAVEDIDEVQRGTFADVRLSAFSQRSTPLVQGEISYVSADRLVDEATRLPYFTVQVTVGERALAEAGNLHLYPGMPAEVFIRTRERSALDYLLEPLTNSLRRAARES